MEIERAKSILFSQSNYLAMHVLLEVKYINLLLLLEMMSELEEKLQTLNSALEARPDDAELHRDRAFLYHQNGNYERALTDLDIVTRLTPEDGNAYVSKGCVLTMLTRYEDALEQFDRADDLGADPFSIHHGRATAFAYLNRFEEAEKEYDQAIAIDKDHISSHRSRGNVRAEMGKLEEALKDCDVVLTAVPHDANTVYTRGNILFQLGRFDAAIKDFSEIIRIYPAHVFGYVARAEAYFSLGRMDDAVADTEKILEIDPFKPEDFLSQQQDQKRKVALISAMLSYEISQNPKDPLLLVARANLSLLKGDLSSCLNDYNVTINHDSANPLLYFLRAGTYIALGKSGDAATDFYTGTRLLPSTDSALRGVAQKLINRPKLACEEVRRILKRKPNDIAALLLGFFANEKVGNREESQKLFYQAAILSFSFDKK